MRLFLLSVAAAVAVVPTAAATSSRTVGTASDGPRLSELGRDLSFRGIAPFRDVQLARPTSILALPATVPFTPTAPTGEIVHIRLSLALYSSADAVVAQQWADFFGGLVHGSELHSLQAYVLTPSEIENVCGRDALACYAADQLLVPADNPAPDLSKEAVATHEYGHHVAAHRVNAPWASVNYGPKRWASVEQVCSKTRAHRLYPGAEDAKHYQLNPGEGFAEAYRVLNERRQGLAEAPWQVVTNALYPDAADLTAVQQDVLSPWTKPTSSLVTGAVSKRAKQRSFTVRTPLDGRLRATLRPAAGEKLRLELFSPSSRRLARATGRKAISVSTIVCGQRALRLRVTRLAGSGTFRVTVAKP